MPFALSKSNRLLILALLLIAGMGIAQAAAPLSPPSNNPSEPLDESSLAQSKSGSLKVGGTTLPVAKASLEIGEASGATGGLLLPRVTTAQRNAITTDGVANAGLTGLQVYNTQLKQTETFDGLNWVGSSATTTAVGVVNDGPAFFVYLSNDNVGSVGWNDVGAVADFTPVASFQAGEFAIPSGDFTPATGVFKPSVPGKYFLTANQWNGYGVAICKNAATPSSGAGGYPGAGCAAGWEATYGGQVSAVFDADGVNDTFKMWVYLQSGQTIRGGSTHYTFFSGIRVGNIPAEPVRDAGTRDVTQKDRMVAYFNLTTGCPAGWTLMDGNNSTINMQGMYMVGTLGPASAIGGAVGNRLGDRENRAVGYHNHSISALAFNPMTLPATSYYRPYINVVTHGFRIDGANLNITGSQYGSNAYYYPYASGSGTISGTTVANTTGTAGGVSGTNAPYVQFLACQQN